MLKKYLTTSTLMALTALCLLGVELGTRTETTYIEGYASTNVLDRHGTVILPGAYEESVERIQNLTLPLFMNHRYDEKNLVGTIIDGFITAKGLWIKAKLRSDINPKHKHLIESGLYAYMSIGGIPQDFDKELGVIYRLDLMEVSITPMPANKHSAIYRVYTEKSRWGVFGRLLGLE